MIRLALVFVVLFAVREASPSDECGALWISLTVSPLINTDPPRPLLISWGNAAPQPGDWIGLLNDSSAIHTPLAYRAVVRHSGVFNTTWPAPVLQSSELKFSAECLDYWAVYVRDNTTILASTCHGTQPTWMEEMKDDLSPRTLWQIFLPGTHDSGSYKQYQAENTETLVVKYTITQEDDILSQLILGSRYIDLRVGHYPSTPEIWWVNHGKARIRPLKELLDGVRLFINNTSEVVILDVQEFPVGFAPGTSTHIALVQYLHSELRYLLASPALGWNSTLGEIWESGNRLILSYDEENISNGSAILWQSVQQRWGDKQTLNGLYKHLRRVESRAPFGRPSAAMAELTPTFWAAVSDQLGGLRSMADTTNLNVSDWYRSSWGQNANVVAVDFLRGTSIVDVALLWNRRRAHNITCS